jgi:hypothetical protein
VHQRHICVEVSGRCLDVHPAVAAAGFNPHLLHFSSPDLNRIEHIFRKL